MKSLLKLDTLTFSVNAFLSVNCTSSIRIVVVLVQVVSEAADLALRRGRVAVVDAAATRRVIG